MLIISAILSAGSVSAWLIRVQHPTRVGMGRDHWQDEQYHIWTTLTFKELDVSANRFTGTVDVEVVPGQ